jgi:predicted permease
VVSHGFWRKRLQSDPAALGRTLEIRGRLYTLLGVLPRDYRSVMGHGVAPEYYAPERLDYTHTVSLIARLRDGMTRVQARDALLAASLVDYRKQPPAVRPLSGFAANAAEEGDDHQVFVFFLMLLGVAAILALIACANVAGLLLARRAARRRELDIRQALGASTWQLARTQLGEAFVLVAAGAAAGLALDAWLRNRLSYVRWTTAYNIPFEFHLQGDRGLFLYALLTALAALLVCSPTSFRPSTVRWNLRNAFVALQVVLSMVLLTLGALFARSFVHVARADLGFDARHTVIAVVHPLPGVEHGAPWRARLIDAVRRVPGVEAATSTGMLPLMGELWRAPLRRQGEAQAAARDTDTIPAGEQFFATLRIPLPRGREFELADAERNPLPVIINQTLASRLFPGAAPALGARLILGREEEQSLEVVGVAADSKMRTLGEPSTPLFYTPDFNGQFLVRVAGEPAQWIEPLRHALAAADPAPALDIRPLRDAVAGALFPMQVAAAFVASMGALGLILSLVGIYGSVSHAVGRRTREFGIRAALGASPERILWTALRDSALLLAAGALAGLVLAIAAVRPLVDLLPDGIDPWDPRLFAAAAFALVVAGILGATLPARRAARVDCVAALRQE